MDASVEGQFFRIVDGDEVVLQARRIELVDSSDDNRGWHRRKRKRSCGDRDDTRSPQCRDCFSCQGGVERHGSVATVERGKRSDLQLSGPENGGHPFFRHGDRGGERSVGAAAPEGWETLTVELPGRYVKAAKR